MKCGEFTELIDSYLTGQIPENQREAFELHYFECDGCFVELKTVERLQSREVPIAVAVTDRGRAARPLFGFLGDWLAWKPVMAAASMLMVALVSFLVVQQSGAGQLEELKEIAAFSPPPYILSETRGNEVLTKGDRTFFTAMSYYRNKDYGRALELLEDITRDPQNRNPQFTFYKGICLFSLDRIEDSIAAFDVIIGDMNPSYYDEALYYKSIALVHLGQSDKALELLRILSEMFSPLSRRAKKMITEITARI